MSWVNLLSITARLVDLHDSGRQLGGTAYIQSETRPGLGDGMWLDIATRLLEYLHEHDIESNNGWMHLNEFIQDITYQSSINEDDVLHVVNTLSSPTNISYLSRGDSDDSVKLRSTKKTNLIERPRQKVTDRCRLTNVGRQALQLSKQTSNWIYTQHDANKILTAITSSDFEAIIPQIVTIEQAIRLLSQEILIMLERPGEEEIWSHYKNKSSQYAKTIEEVSESVSRALELLSIQTTIEQFHAWEQQQKKTDTSIEFITLKLHNLILSVEKLRRKFADLITSLASNKRNIIGNVKFNKIALSMAFNAPAEEYTDLCFKALGPWQVDSTLVSPIDLYGTMRPAVSQETHQTAYFEDETEEPLPTPIEAFLLQYKDDIEKSLKQGPISLSQAFKNNYICVSTEDSLTSLVGIYTSPEWLGDMGVNIGISFSHDLFKEDLADGTTLIGNELLMHLIEQDSL